MLGGMPKVALGLHVEIGGDSCEARASALRGSSRSKGSSIGLENRRMRNVLRFALFSLLPQLDQRTRTLRTLEDVQVIEIGKSNLARCVR